MKTLFSRLFTLEPSKKNEGLPPWLPGAGAILLVVIAHSFVGRALAPNVKGDPDTYFTLAMAREASQQMVIRTIPQVEDLGYGKRFNDKNFLYTWLTGITYRMGGENTTLHLVAIFSFLTLLGLYLTARRYAPPLWACLTPLLLLLDPYAATRLFKLRPHVAAMAAFAWILYGILRRRPQVTGAACALFALSYNMFPVPVAVLGLAALCFGITEPGTRKTLKFGAIGLAAGIVLNPYFPGNIGWAAKLVRIAVNADQVAAFDRPLENVPLPTDVFLKNYSFYLLLAFAALFLFRSRVAKAAKRLSSSLSEDELSRETLFLGLGALGLWAAVAVSPRAEEYAVPMTLLLVPCLIGRFALPRRWHAAGAIAALTLFLVVPRAASVYSAGLPYVRSEVLIAAAESLPADAKGKKVFNCRWDVGPFLFYSRPDVRFVDLTDPSLLANASPQLYQMRHKLREGTFPYPYGLIHDLFHADYVFCNDPVVVGQLERDPHFSRIYPPKISLSRMAAMAELTAVYTVAKDPVPNFISRFEYAPFRTDHNTPSTATPEKPTKWADFTVPAPPPYNTWPYQNLLLVKQETRPLASERGPELCTTLRPKADELKRHVGASLLGVGGGPDIRLWWNGVPLFRSERRDVPATALWNLIRLPRALASQDRVEAVVCTSMQDAFYGFALSFWKPEEVDRLCEKKGGPTSAGRDKTDWKYRSVEMETCLASIAAPAEP